jgi:hypothetical protein
MVANKTLLEIEAKLFIAYAKRIKESLGPANLAQKKYQREFAAIRLDSCRPASAQAFYQALTRTEVVFVGDYRSLSDSKKVFVNLISEIKKRTEKPVYALVDWMSSDRQKAIDAFYSQGENNNELAKGLYAKGSLISDFASDYNAAIASLRKLRVPLWAIDSDTQKVTNPAERDSLAIERIEWVLRKIDKGICFISVGDSRMGKKHLPGRLTALQKKMAIAQVFVNSPKVYFKNRSESRPTQHQKMPHFCIGTHECFHIATQHPLYVQRFYLNWLEGNSGKPCSNFNLQNENQEIFKTLAALFVREKAKIQIPRILYWEDLPARMPALTRPQTDAFLSHLKRGESFCLPEKRFIFISNKLRFHVAEELCHYIKALGDLSSAKPIDNEVDYLYRTSLHEMFGFLGSKFIDELRQVPAWDRPQTRKIGRAIQAFGFLTAERDQVNHVRLEKYSPETLAIAAHYVGYQLGEKIFQLYRKGKISNAFLVKITREKFNDPIRAKIIYHELQKITQT